ncbi:MAG: hypothetical protein CMK59_06810 [Proteobacteria bacterium]|nr:hypothetical protein [Pseudomonadota bacterium]
MPKGQVILGFIGFAVVSFFLGLFILPQKVELVRIKEYPVSADQVWSKVNTIEGWDAWDPWGYKSKGETRSFGSEEHRGQLTLDSVDEGQRRLVYNVDTKSAMGDIFVEKIPEGTRVFWHHSYQSGFGPLSRMDHWLKRGQFALELDQGLNNLDAILDGELKVQD